MRRGRGRESFDGYRQIAKSPVKKPQIILEK
jgi:hypothetical protein